MNKILTISIAAYNVEKYIKQTLDSLCIDEVIDLLEVFVVDDGGKDNTLEIAKQYERRFPESIIPVHKVNGGWGSTVNYSIQHASGKYFRLLDGDDYFDRDGLIQLVQLLKSTDVDAVYTPYRRFDDTTGKTVEKFGADTRCERNQSIDIKKAFDTDFVMHSSSFRTEILKQNGISVLEHCFYTDNEYRTKAMAFVNLVYITDIEVYQYRVGREGQSVDLSGLKKHYKENLQVFRALIEFYKKLSENDNRSLVLKNTKSVANYYYSVLILLDSKDELIAFDKELKEYGDELYNTSDRTVNKLRTSGFNNVHMYCVLNRLRARIANKLKMLINR